MRYVATAKAFVDGRLVQIGDEHESDTDPGFPFVPAASYRPYEDIVERVDVGSGFVRSSRLAGRTWGLPPGVNPVDKSPDGVPKMTVLRSRNPHEWRY